MSTKTARSKGSQRKQAPKPPKGRPTPKRPSTASRRSGGLSWGALIAAAAVVGLGAMLFFGSKSPKAVQPPGTTAPAFTLPSTTGQQVSLSDYRGKNVLLYFSEGVGCDACFYQTVELEQHAQELAQRGITLLPIVVNPMSQVRPELQRFGITTPYLIDANKQVSREYGTLGTGMHADLPGHGFVLVDGAGKIVWSGNYPSMYISTADLMAAVGPSLS